MIVAGKSEDKKVGRKQPAAIAIHKIKKNQERQSVTDLRPNDDMCDNSD